MNVLKQACRGQEAAVRQMYDQLPQLAALVPTLKGSLCHTHPPVHVP